MHPLTLGLVMADTELANAVAACLRNLPVRVVLERATYDAVVFQNQLKRACPDVLLVDLTLVRERFPELMSLVRSLPEPPAVVAIHTTPHPETILAALRAGASEFLYPPIAEQIVREALERIAQAREKAGAQKTQAKVLGFLSAAGGCGATTVACHVAAELRKLTEQDILITDFDVVAGMVGFWMNAKNSHCVVDAAMSVHRLDSSLWRGLVAAVQPHLDVLPAPTDAVIEGFGDVLNYVELVRFSRFSYGYVIADLGHSLDPFVMELLAEVDTVYLVTTPAIAALYQAKRILRRLQELKFAQDRVRLVVNQTDRNQGLAIPELEKLLGPPVDAVLPIAAEEIEDSHGEGRLISGGSEFGKRISRLAGRIAGVATEEKSRSRFSLFRQFGVQES